MIMRRKSRDSGANEIERKSPLLIPPVFFTLCIVILIVGTGLSIYRNIQEKTAGEKVISIEAEGFGSFVEESGIAGAEFSYDGTETQNLIKELQDNGYIVKATKDGYSMAGLPGLLEYALDMLEGYGAEISYSGSMRPDSKRSEASAAALAVKDALNGISAIAEGSGLAIDRITSIRLVDTSHKGLRTEASVIVTCDAYPES